MDKCPERASDLPKGTQQPERNWEQHCTEPQRLLQAPVSMPPTCYPTQISAFESKLRPEIIQKEKAWLLPQTWICAGVPAPTTGKDPFVRSLYTSWGVCTVFPPPPPLYRWEN